MLPRYFYAIFLAAILTQGCTRAAQPTNLGEHKLSSCVFDRSDSRRPERGKDWDICQDTVTYTARITEDHEAAGDSVFRIYINEEDHAAVAAFQERNIHSFIALRKGKNVLTLVALFGAYESPWELRLDPDEAPEFRASLK